MSFDLQAIGCKVFSRLTEFPELRDDDRALLASIWNSEMKDIPQNRGFIVEFLDGKLSHPETVTRMRRKIQEKHESLRGEKWDVRHNMEAAFCQQLTFFDKW